jgi:hypothetical protein
MTTTPLKLRAADAEDLQVISAVLQDAIAPVCDMLFQPDDKTFIMVVHRRMSEAKPDPCVERICCAVHVRGVTQVLTHDIDLHQRDRMLDLLAIIPEANHIDFIFAGNSCIRIVVSEWAMKLEDFGEAWPAFTSPCHETAQT